MIGEIGALGGGILPNLLGQSKQHTGSYSMGFTIYAAFAVVILIMLRVVSVGWTRSWVGAGGRALSEPIPVAVMAGDGESSAVPAEASAA
jgi:NNP family nitrate/nitrite transporter-like MFS transporter